MRCNAIAQGLDSSMHGEHAYDEDAIKRLQVL
jgi:hypothetical protein